MKITDDRYGAAQLMTDSRVRGERKSNFVKFLNKYTSRKKKRDGKGNLF